MIAIALGIRLSAVPVQAAPEQPPAQLDFCAPVVSNPLRRWPDRRTCRQAFPIDEVAGAEVVLMDAVDLPDDSGPPETLTGDPCHDPQSLDSQASYLRELRARSCGRGTAPLAIAKTRFDLVGPHLSMRPGFSGRFLLPTARPWSEVLRFFEEDRSPDCVAGGCRFAEPDPSSRNGDPVGLAPLVARIDETAGKGTSRSVVYYLQRGSAGNKIFRATNALANLDDPAFRAWRVAEARRMLERGGYDAVMLNHKLHQYRSEGHWLGGPAAPDVTALNRLGDTLWTAPPSGYGYPEYVAGWHALASDLRAGGVPYGVILSVAPWRRRTLPGSDSASDENALIREVARGARVVLLDGRVGKRGALFVAVQRELEAAGARVVPIDSSCGLPGSRLGSPRASE